MSQLMVNWEKSFTHLTPMNLKKKTHQSKECWECVEEFMAMVNENYIEWNEKSLIHVF